MCPPLLVSVPSEILVEHPKEEAKMKLTKG
jgi:hypothetical protein